MHLTLSTADGGNASAFREDEVGSAPQASLGYYAELAVGDAGQARPNADFREEAQSTTVHTRIVFQKLREPADEGIQHFRTASKTIGLESSWANGDTGTLVVEEARLTPPLANSVDV